MMFPTFTFPEVTRLTRDGTRGRGQLGRRGQTSCPPRVWTAGCPHQADLTTALLAFGKNDGYVPSLIPASGGVLSHGHAQSHNENASPRATY
jgi:hypothetical protein